MQHIPYYFSPGSRRSAPVKVIGYDIHAHQLYLPPQEIWVLMLFKGNKWMYGFSAGKQPLLSPHDRLLFFL
jgi:hypothetical protein